MSLGRLLFPKPRLIPHSNIVESKKSVKIGTFEIKPKLNAYLVVSINLSAKTITETGTLFFPMP